FEATRSVDMIGVTSPPYCVGVLRRRYAFLPEALARRLARAYGTRAGLIIGDARRLDDLGRDFGAGLTEAEVEYLCRAEWARAASDILWRRSKLGLRLSAAQSAGLADFIGRA
ncbi:MAG TPA: glycerol-3-phosphate dehydrogenase C-terminal domain-containing protein, partial [Azospirillaceae bacterium]|nr:glycerol-3-phosphate dehydrogenase C-terminal domain-containing protein [Azospirillaceae bacterium]